MRLPNSRCALLAWSALKVFLLYLCIIDLLSEASEANLTQKMSILANRSTSMCCHGLFALLFLLTHQIIFCPA